MPQYLLKASAEEFDSWRAAAGGKGQLAGWIRRVLNDAAAGVVRVPSADVLAERRNEVVAYAHPADVPAVKELLARVPERAFKPDPRPVSTKKAR